MIALLAFFLMAPDLVTVPQVDLRKYSGVWYEMGRLPNKFQKDCTGDVRATYKLHSDGTLKVTNQCREQGKSAVKKAEGVGRVAKEGKGSNSVLEVRFAPAILSFLNTVWGDYRIIELDDQYRHAVVGSNDRKYLWVLSRSKTMSDELFSQLLAAAAKQGFDTKPIRRTPQN